MDFFTLSKKRYSVRKFISVSLKQEEIDKLLEVANLAPTGCNNQPQRILVLNSADAVERLKKCTKCHFDAPSAMLFCYNRNECWQRKYDGAVSGEIDTTIVATHVMLAACEMGLGSCMVMHFDPQKMRDEFCIPEHIKPVLLLVLGHPAPDSEPLPLHEQTKDISQTVLYDRF